MVVPVVVQTDPSDLVAAAVESILVEEKTEPVDHDYQAQVEQETNQDGNEDQGEEGEQKDVLDRKRMREIKMFPSDIN